MGKSKENKKSIKNKKHRYDDSGDSTTPRQSSRYATRPRQPKRYFDDDHSSLEVVSSAGTLSSSSTSLSTLSFSESSGASVLNLEGRRKKRQIPLQPRRARLNQQRVKQLELSDKAKKKLKKEDNIRDVIAEAVFETEKHNLSEQLYEWYQKKNIAEDAENQFPTLTRVRVEMKPLFGSFIRAVAVYPAYALAKRSLGPADLITTTTNVVYGRLWLGWAAICYDIWTRCITGGLSIFEEAHPHYRRFFHMAKPMVRGEFMYLWNEIEDFFTNFNNNLLGPNNNFLLTWTTGQNDVVTGRRVLVNSVPVVTEQILLNEGVECAREIFQNCLSEGYSMSKMTKVPKYIANCSPAAFANRHADGSNEIELSQTYELEVKFRKNDLDIAELDLGQPRQGRVCIHKEGAISGTGPFHYKLVHPDLFKEQVTILQKEFPITEYFAALLGMLVPATRMLEGDGVDMSLDVITPGPTNKFSNMSMGQLLTVGLLDCCQRMIMGNSIGQLSGCYSGSSILGGDVRYFIPITTYGDAAPLALREAMKLISTHFVAPNAITRRSPIGKEYYLPVISTRGQFFGANPLMTSDTPVFDNFVSNLYEQASTVNGWTFATLPNPAIPNFVTVADVTNMFFVGPTPTKAIKQINNVYGSLQASLGVSTLTDTKMTDATVMYFSRVVTKSTQGQWDTTMTNIVTQVSNRFPLSNMTLGAMPSITPVFYADEINPTTWFSVYGEYCSLLGDAQETFLDQVTRVYVLFAHQRATWGGFATNEYYIAQVYQGLGGGFFYGLSNAVSGILKTVMNGARFITGVHDSLNASTQKQLDSVCSILTDTSKFDPYAMLNTQDSGHLDEILIA